MLTKSNSKNDIKRKIQHNNCWISDKTNIKKRIINNA